MNEHDLHAALGDLARRGSDDQAARLRDGDGLSAAAITRRASRARRRRAGAGAVTGMAVVAAIVLGGSVLTERPEPQPADTPTPTITRPAPTPSRTPEPAPSRTPDPSPSSDAAEAVDPARDVDPVGLLQSYPSAPRATWTVAGSDLWTPTRYSGPPWLSDVTATWHSYTGFRAVAAGTAWLVAIGVPDDERVAMVDSATGTIGWSTASGDGLDACGGAYDGLLVCLGRSATDDSEVQLREPATGAVVRTAGPGGDGMAVLDDAAVVFAGDSTDVRIRVVDLATGGTRSDSTLAGAVDPEGLVGDGATWWDSAGSLALVHGPGYNLVVDADDGTVSGQSRATVALRPDGWALGTDPDGSVRGVGPDGQDVALPGTSATTPVVWVPSAGVDVPLLVGSDPSDGLADRVTAVEPESGATLWSVAGSWAAEGVVGDTVLLRAEDALVAVDVRTGAARWRADGFYRVIGTDGTRVVLDPMSAGRPARALDLADGREAWSLALKPGEMLGQVDGTLVVLGAEGSISRLVP